MTFTSFTCPIVLIRFSCTIVNGSGEHVFQTLYFSVLKFSLSSRFWPFMWVCSGNSHCCLNLHFPDDQWFQHLFICLFSACVSSLVRCLLSSLAHFLITLFSYCWVLRILTVLHQIFFPNSFFQSMACLLSLLTFSFTEEKLF